MNTVNDNVGDTWCSVTYMWKSTLNGLNTINDKQGEVYTFPKNVTPLDKSTNCWSYCDYKRDSYTYRSIVSIPINIDYWRWTYTVGFIVSLILAALQLFSVCFKQEMRNNTGDNAPAIELGFKTSVNLDEEDLNEGDSGTF